MPSDEGTAWALARQTGNTCCTHAEAQDYVRALVFSAYLCILVTMQINEDMRPMFELHAQLCQALANEHRLAILYSLKDGEKCVSDLATELDIAVPNVSQHLRVLRQRLLVRARKEGQTVYYSITNPKFIQACTLIRQALLEQHRAEGQSLLAADVAAELTAGAAVSETL